MSGLWEADHGAREASGSVQSLRALQQPGFPVPHQLARLAQTHVRPVRDAIQASRLLSGRPGLLLPSIRVFPRESVLRVGWPEDWRFSFSLSPSDEYSGLISSRMDGLGLLAVQGTLKSLLQHRSPKASILRHSSFFILHLSHLYVTAGETVAFTRQTLVTDLVSALRHAVQVGHSFSPKERTSFHFAGAAGVCGALGQPPKMKSFPLSVLSPSICHEVMGRDAMILVVRMLSLKPRFSLSSFTFLKGLFSSSSLSPRQRGEDGCGPVPRIPPPLSGSERAPRSGRGGPAGPAGQS